MTAIDFYDDLDSANPETIDLNGGVLIHKNKNKWHLCQKNATSVGHACGNGGPPNPNRTGYTRDDYYEARFNNSCEVVTPAQALEKNRVCTFCERILQREFDLNRLIVAVSEDTPIDVAVERFVNRREEVLE